MTGNGDNRGLSSEPLAFRRNTSSIFQKYSQPQLTTDSNTVMAPLAIDEESLTTRDGSLNLNSHVDNKRRDLANGLLKTTSTSSIVPDVHPSTTTCSLGDLQTEQKNVNTSDIDGMSSLDLCRML